MCGGRGGVFGIRFLVLGIDLWMGGWCQSAVRGAVWDPGVAQWGGSHDSTAALQLPLPLISCAFSWARLHGTVLVENSFLSLSPTVNSAERWQFSLDLAEDLMCWCCQSFADKTCVWAKQHHGWRLVAVLINQLSWLLGRSGAGIQVRAWISRFHLSLQTNLLKFSGL